MSYTPAPTVDEIWEGAIGTAYSPLTREAALRWAGGIGLRKTDIAITTDGAATVNCFKVTGCIRLQSILLIIQTVTDATVFSDVKFTLYDGTNTVDLTDEINGSGCVAGSKFFKGAAATEDTIFLKSDKVRMYENTDKKPLTEAFINAKSGVDNFIQLSYTGNAATDIVAVMYIRYTPTCTSGAVTVVA